jgi:hypothetical protein
MSRNLLENVEHGNAWVYDRAFLHVKWELRSIIVH